MPDTVHINQEQAGQGPEGSGLMVRILQIEVGLAALKETVYRLDHAARLSEASLSGAKEERERMTRELEKLRACIDDAERQLAELKQFVDGQKRIVEDARAFWRKIWHDTASTAIKMLIFGLISLLVLGGLYKLSDVLSAVK